MYRKFVSIVTQICDRASTSVPWGEFSSRDQFHAKDIQQLRSIHDELLITEHASDLHQSPQVESSLTDMRIDSSPASAGPYELREGPIDAESFPWTGPSPTDSTDTRSLIPELNL